MIKNQMTWVGGQKRWIKEYRGKTYAVSCKQLRGTGHEGAERPRRQPVVAGEAA